MEGIVRLLGQYTITGHQLVNPVIEVATAILDVSGQPYIFEPNIAYGMKSMQDSDGNLYLGLLTTGGWRIFSVDSFPTNLVA